MKSQNSFYERHVKDYQRVTNLWFPKRHKKLISLIDHNAKQVLDVGCGTGVMLDRIALQFPNAKMAGIDISEPMITFAKEQYPGFSFKVGSAEKLLFADEQFDVVTNAISFHHYHNPKRAIAEAYRVLEPGGQFLLMDITPKRTITRKLNNFAARYIVRDGHVAFHALDEVGRLFKEAGLGNVEQSFVGLPGVYITSGRKPKTR